MLINAAFFKVLSIVFPILVCVGLSIWVRRKFKSYYGVIIGIVLSGMLFGLSQAGFGSLYIVSDVEKVEAYWVIGAIHFELENGTVLDEPFDPMKVVLINNSGQELVLEEIVYHKARPQKLDSLLAKLNVERPQDDIFYIAPGTSARFSLPQKEIDFFFDEPIPEQLEVYGSREPSKYWLH